ncbi:MAG: hypothetical protein K8J08_17880, partial [Thermoanaerobaculia bacterium]|nr:hypothetical protein [Thermoanaerobaculia bacterium]
MAPEPPVCRNLNHYECFADLFDYPEEDYPEVVRRAIHALGSRYPVAVTQLELFAESMPSPGASLTERELDQLQEIFTRSFDVQSVTTLGVSYVMFGDDYKRGEMLVNLNREHREAGVDCGSELSDHLPNVLRLIARWQDPELTQEFVAEIVHPAVQMMTAEFGSSRIKQRDKLYKKHYKTLIDSSAERGTMFRYPLASLALVLKEDFGLSEWVPPERTSDFLHSVRRELDIEANEGRPPEQSAPAREKPAYGHPALA